MQLDSKESDIEQLREKLNDLQQRMDNSSVTSLQTDETDSNVAGRVSTGFQRWMLVLLFLCTETQLTEMLIPILQLWKSLFEEQKGWSDKAKLLLYFTFRAVPFDFYEEGGDMLLKQHQTKTL